MAQQFVFENDTQQTVNFSSVANGNAFVYGGVGYWKLDNNNPNAVKLSDGSISKFTDTDQVIIPSTVIVKFE